MAVYEDGTPLHGGDYVVTKAYVDGLYGGDEPEYKDHKDRQIKILKILNDIKDQEIKELKEKLENNAK